MSSTQEQKPAKSAVGTLGREFGKTIGSTLGGKTGGKVGASLARGIMETFMKR